VRRSPFGSVADGRLSFCEQEHPQAWTRVDDILEKTQHEQSKFFVSSPPLFMILVRGAVHPWGMLATLSTSELEPPVTGGDDGARAGSQHAGEVREGTLEGASSGPA